MVGTWHQSLRLWKQRGDAGEGDTHLSSAMSTFAQLSESKYASKTSRAPSAGNAYVAVSSAGITLLSIAAVFSSSYNRYFVFCVFLYIFLVSVFQSLPFVDIRAYLPYVEVTR